MTRKRIDVLDAKKREDCGGGVSYALGNTAYKVVCVRGERGLEYVVTEERHRGTPILSTRGTLN